MDAARQGKPTPAALRMEDTAVTISNIADRRQKHQDAALRLETMLTGLMDSDQFRRYLHAVSRFHRYSWANVAMILSQRPTASRVNSYRRWQAIGRQVKQGEKGIAIWTPRTRKAADGEHELTGYGLGYVFAIEQTEGDELPDAPEPMPITGHSIRVEAAHAVLLDVIAAHGVRFMRENTRPASGYWNPSQRVIALDETLSGNEATAVLIHECAHMLADHRGTVSKSDAETVAECVTFVVMDWLDVDTSQFSTPYVAGWGREIETFKRNLSEVQRIAYQITETLDDALTDDLDLEPAA